MINPLDEINYAYYWIHLQQSEIPNKKIKLEPLDDSVLSVDSTPQSPTRSDYSMGSGAVPQDDTSNDALVVDVDSPAASFNTSKYQYAS